MARSSSWPQSMALATPAMEQEAMCPICMEYLTEPVSVDCGHNFCRDCITNYYEKWEEIETSLECPLCKARIKKGNLRPNWQLSNIVEQLKCLQLKTAKDNLCEKHKIELLPNEDGKLVCADCDIFPEHRTRRGHPLKRVMLGYKGQSYTSLETARMRSEERRKSLLGQSYTSLETTRKRSEERRKSLLGQPYTSLETARMRSEERRKSLLGQSYTSLETTRKRSEERRKSLLVSPLSSFEKATQTPSALDPSSWSRDEEAVCSICLTFRTNPVTLDCGCSFCWGCFILFCERGEKRGSMKCPVCTIPFQQFNVWPLQHLRIPAQLFMASRAASSVNKSVETPSTKTLVPPSTEVRCSICLEYLTDQVTLHCCHKFCQTCISEYCEKREEKGLSAACPLCKAQIQRESLPPNWHLADIRKLFKLFSPKTAKENICVKHNEKQNLLCKVDKELVCVTCERSPEHRTHTVILLEEAVQEYKDRISSHLKIFKKKRDTFLRYRADAEKESQDLFKQTRTERVKTVAEFRQMHYFLQQQERLLMTQMDKVEKEIVRKKDEHPARLSEELASLEDAICEMERKCLQPASAFLQDIKSTLQRYEKQEAFENSVVFPPALKWRIWEFCDINPFLKVVMKQFQDTLLSGLQLQKANVTLDVDTAHPQLVLSEDHKNVRWGDQRQDLFQNPERFNVLPFVLGCEGFKAGRHFWEVAVEGEGEWAVGLAKQSVRRKGLVSFNPDKGIWAVGKLAGQYKALDLPHRPPLPLSWELKRIRVTLNYAASRVAFFDADTAGLLHTFSGALFSGEALHPAFYILGEAHLAVSS